MTRLTLAFGIIKSSCKYLSFADERALLDEVDLLNWRISNPYFRIAVLAPFNFGKSTFINALLGSEILPSRAVRTTGLPVKIRYGKRFEVIINFISGKTVRQGTSDILEIFSTLDTEGRRNYDVVSVEIFSKHRILKNGVEIIDLPGANDNDEQDKLIKDEILKSNLVVQILNANQTFTLDERNKNKEWLLDRGIETSIFVINKINKIESYRDKRMF